MRAFFITLFTPLARHMQRVNPNTLTLVSLLAGLAAGGAFVLAHRSAFWYAVAALLLAVSGAADSLDGIVARMYERTTAAGDFFDNFGDRLTEIAVVSGIAFSPDASSTLGLYVLVVTLLHGYLITLIKADFGVRRYHGLGKAEQFVALIAFAAVLAFSPGQSLALAGRVVTLPNMFLAVLGVATVIGLAHRLVGAFRLCATSRSPE